MISLNLCINTEACGGLSLRLLSVYSYPLYSSIGKVMESSDHTENGDLPVDFGSQL